MSQRTKQPRPEHRPITSTTSTHSNSSAKPSRSRSPRPPRQPRQPRKPFTLDLHLYSRPLHPELFRVHRTEAAERRAYHAEVSLTDAGHVVEFDAGDCHLTEVLVNTSDYPPLELPENGLIEVVPCRGERCHEADIAENVRYMLSTQEEQLPPSLYEATKAEILDYAQARELMWVEVPAAAATDDAPGRGRFLGVLDVERRANELLVQSFHLFDEFSMVVKTQGLIEVLKPGRK